MRRRAALGSLFGLISAVPSVAAAASPQCRNIQTQLDQCQAALTAATVPPIIAPAINLTTTVGGTATATLTPNVFGEADWDLDDTRLDGTFYATGDWTIEMPARNQFRVTFLPNDIGTARLTLRVMASGTEYRWPIVVQVL